jgi:hypothetical protein
MDFERAIDEVDIFQNQSATVIDNFRTVYDGVSDVVAVTLDLKTTAWWRQGQCAIPWSSTKNARAGRLSTGDRGKRRAVSFGRIRVKKIEGQTGRFVKTLGLSL